MLAKKIVTFSRSTGEKIKENVGEEICSNSDDYWKNVSRLIFNSKSYQEFLKPYMEGNTV